jgi:hypothetical protein
MTDHPYTTTLKDGILTVSSLKFADYHVDRAWNAGYAALPADDLFKRVIDPSLRAIEARAARGNAA